MSGSEIRWSEERVFVTGATGIVGSWLVKHLLDLEANVVVLVRDWDPQSELIRSGTVQRTNVVAGALEDFSVLERAINEHEISTVFHLGAQAIVGAALRSPLPTFEANIRGSYNLLEACRIHEGSVRRVVVASSDKAYGDSQVLPYTEDMPLNGRNPYDVSKSCTDRLALTYAHTYSLPAAVARCGNIYGGGDLNWSRIVPGTIRSLLRGEQPLIRSNGAFVRDYIYVEDVAQAYIRLAECVHRPEVRGSAFNFSPEQPLAVLEVVDAIRTRMGCKHIEPRVLDVARAEILSQHLSAERAATLLNWRAKYSLLHGLDETIPWYREFLES
jgi:CDP-glucose 4,6-dehydratase